MKASHKYYCLQLACSAVAGFLLYFAGVRFMHEPGMSLLMMLLFVSPGLCVRSLGLSEASFLIQAGMFIAIWAALDLWGSGYAAIAGMVAISALHTWLVVQEERLK